MQVDKIGFSTHLKKRLCSLQTAHPYPLQVYATIKNVPRQKELDLHELFENKRLNGEWFEITTDIIDLVCTGKLD